MFDDLRTDSEDFNATIFGKLSDLAVEKSSDYMIWLRDNSQTDERMKKDSRYIINALAGTGLPDAFRPYVDPVALISWVLEEDNYSKRTIEAKMQQFLRVSQKVNHLIIRLSDAQSKGDHQQESCAKDWGLELKANAQDAQDSNLIRSRL